MPFRSTKGKMKTYQKFNKGQQKAFSDFLKFAQTQLKGGGIQQPSQIPTPAPLEQPENLPFQSYKTLPVTYRPLDFDVEPLAQQAQARFQQQTIPSIAERFTALGAGSQGSSAFAQQLGGAGADLQRELAALRSLYGYQTAQQNEQNRLGVGQFNVGAGLDTARLNEGNRLAYGQANAGNQYQFGAYNQQFPFNIQQQNIANLLGQQGANLQAGGNYAGIAAGSPYERAYFAGQPGWGRALLGASGEIGGKLAGAGIGYAIGGPAGAAAGFGGFGK